MKMYRVLPVERERKREEETRDYVRITILTVPIRSTRRIKT